MVASKALAVQAVEARVGWPGRSGPMLRYRCEWRELVQPHVIADVLQFIRGGRCKTASYPRRCRCSAYRPRRSWPFRVQAVGRLVIRTALASWKYCRLEGGFVVGEQLPCVRHVVHHAQRRQRFVVNGLHDVFLGTCVQGHDRTIMPFGWMSSEIPVIVHFPISDFVIDIEGVNWCPRAVWYTWPSLCPPASAR